MLPGTRVPVFVPGTRVPVFVPGTRVPGRQNGIARQVE